MRSTICFVSQATCASEPKGEPRSFARIVFSSSKATPSGECPHLDFYLSNRSSIHETIRYAPTERKKKEAAKRHSHPPIEVIEHNGDIVMGVPPTTTLQV